MEKKEKKEKRKAKQRKRKKVADLPPFVNLSEQT